MWCRSLLLWGGSLLLAIAVHAKSDRRELHAEIHRRVQETVEGHLLQHGHKFGLSADDLGRKRVSDVHTTKHGITHMYLKQVIAGIDVVNALLSAHVGADGVVQSVKSEFVGNLAQSVTTEKPVLSAAEAVKFAAFDLGIALDSSKLTVIEDVGGITQKVIFGAVKGLSLDPIPANLAYFALESGEVRLTWEVRVNLPDNIHLYNCFVDAENGAMLNTDNWVDLLTEYQVYALPRQAPVPIQWGEIDIDDIQERDIVADPWKAASKDASPFGWQDVDGKPGADSSVTSGNNVCAQEDTNFDNSPCGNSNFSQPSGGSDLNKLSFRTAMNLKSNNPADWRDAGVVQGYYWCNIMHDILYEYGFDEVAGNFQVNNYGKGGLGNDAVLLSTQFGPRKGILGAFSSRPDGVAPSMRMYMWDPTGYAVTLQTALPDGKTKLIGSYAEFGPPSYNVTTDFARLVLANDSVGDTRDACQVLPPGSLTGNMALVLANGCDFPVKVKNCQDAGAIGVIVIELYKTTIETKTINLFTGANASYVTIPSVGVSRKDGLNLYSNFQGKYVKLGPEPTLDSTFDASTVVHEYCHGLTNRLVGGPSNVNCLRTAQSGAEGWSDYCSLFMFQKATDTSTLLRAKSPYTNGGTGERFWPYTTDMAYAPQTFGGLSAYAPGDTFNGAGQFWAATLWDVHWALINIHGFSSNLYTGTGGNNICFQLVVDALKRSPCNPDFVELRDAILEANEFTRGGADRDAIWAAFARRGLGFSAKNLYKNDNTRITQAFDLPPSCWPNCVVAAPTPTPTPPNGGTCPPVSYSVDSLYLRVPPSGVGSSTKSSSSTTLAKALISGCPLVKKVIVRLTTLTHTDLSDLRINLIHPDKTFVELAENVGENIDNRDYFKDTVFDDDAALSIRDTASTWPYTGSYRPFGKLSALNYKPGNGNWTLEIWDVGGGGDIGNLTAWGLDLDCYCAVPPTPTPTPTTPIPVPTPTPVPVPTPTPTPTPTPGCLLSGVNCQDSKGSLGTCCGGTTCVLQGNSGSCQQITPTPTPTPTPPTCAAKNAPCGASGACCTGYTCIAGKGSSGPHCT